MRGYSTRKRSGGRATEGGERRKIMIGRSMTDEYHGEEETRLPGMKSSHMVVSKAFEGLAA